MQHDRMHKSTVKITADSKQALEAINSRMLSEVDRRDSREEEMKSFAKSLARTNCVSRAAKYLPESY